MEISSCDCPRQALYVSSLFFKIATYHPGLHLSSVSPCPLCTKVDVRTKSMCSQFLVTTLSVDKTHHRYPTPSMFSFRIFLVGNFILTRPLFSWSTGANHFNPHLCSEVIRNFSYPAYCTWVKTKIKNHRKTLCNVQSAVTNVSKNEKGKKVGTN